MKCTQLMLYIPLIHSLFFFVFLFLWIGDRCVSVWILHLTCMMTLIQKPIYQKMKNSSSMWSSSLFKFMCLHFALVTYILKALMTNNLLFCNDFSRFFFWSLAWMTNMVLHIIRGDNWSYFNTAKCFDSLW